MLRVYSAHHPRDRGISHGKYHLVTDAAIRHGRFVRRAGQALCQTPSRTFWGLYEAVGVRPAELAVRPGAFCETCMWERGRLPPEQQVVAEPAPPPPPAVTQVKPPTREELEDMAKKPGLMGFLARAMLRPKEG